MLGSCGGPSRDSIVRTTNFGLSMRLGDLHGCECSIEAGQTRISDDFPLPQGSSWALGRREPQGQAWVDPGLRWGGGVWGGGSKSSLAKLRRAFLATGTPPADVGIASCDAAVNADAT